MAEPRIDVQVETNDAPPTDGKKHPNTCPKCQSHYRDDELEENLWVCGHCGHHFPMRARARIVSLADEGSFVEEAADLRGRSTIVGAGLSGLVPDPDNVRRLERLTHALGL